jgi:phenylpyruvate tautomerase PptA (4-oxalocrotonate tautomerase family)
MPLIRIETRKRRTPSEKKAVMEAVHSALREALKIPERDRQIRYSEYDPVDFEAPPDKSDAYTIVEITLFAGRSADAKRALYRDVVKNLGELGIASQDVMIVLVESPKENWGVRGGLPASEVDLGFTVEV